MRFRSVPGVPLAAVLQFFHRVPTRTFAVARNGVVAHRPHWDVPYEEFAELPMPPAQAPAGVFVEGALLGARWVDGYLELDLEPSVPPPGGGEAMPARKAA